MSKIICFVQTLISKAIGHKYNSITLKMPFINISFAPVPIHSSKLAV